MSQQFDAIYDNGVLRPLAPLLLPDQTRVKVTVDSAPSPSSQSHTEAQVPPPPDSDVLARQKVALRELWQEIDKLPQTQNNDGWSVRQHDELLYGGKK